MDAAGTDMLQVGSSDSTGITSSRDQIVSDLRELADLLAEHNYRMSYENWCWSSHAPSWRDVWDIVQKVNKPNVGLCLDTFQTAGGEWGDPTTSSGIREHPDGIDGLKSDFQNSLRELSSNVPPEKIYFLQISDAYKPRQPFDPAPDETGLRPRGRWSHDFRPMPFNGGYLPVTDATRAVLKTGFRGWFSVEVFDGGPDGKGKDYDDPNAFAREAMGLLNKLLEESHCHQFGS
ncbi:MAG: hypothetical protein M1816_007352 [Peltula sp. TS41687]|nr:MAG: hypothetical protein M1816_007352 [Peltula sp. TS41687]